jgi:hypothetical protein
LDYQAALQYLYGLTDYEKERIARYDPATLDLSRVRRVEVENAATWVRLWPWRSTRMRPGTHLHCTYTSPPFGRGAARRSPAEVARQGRWVRFASPAPSLWSPTPARRGHSARATPYQKQTHH